MIYDAKAYQHAKLGGARISKPISIIYEVYNHIQVLVFFNNTFNFYKIFIYERI